MIFERLLAAPVAMGAWVMNVDLSTLLLEPNGRWKEPERTLALINNIPTGPKRVSWSTGEFVLASTGVPVNREKGYMIEKTFTHLRGAPCRRFIEKDIRSYSQMIGANGYEIKTIRNEDRFWSYAVAFYNLTSI